MGSFGSAIEIDGGPVGTTHAPRGLQGRMAKLAVGRDEKLMILTGPPDRPTPASVIDSTSCIAPVNRPQTVMDTVQALSALSVYNALQPYRSLTTRIIQPY